jgi:hypothetical protein
LQGTAEHIIEIHPPAVTQLSTCCGASFSVHIYGAVTGNSSISPIFRMRLSQAEFELGYHIHRSDCIMSFRNVAPSGNALRVVETGGSIPYHEGLDRQCKNGTDTVVNPLKKKTAMLNSSLRTMG